MPLPTEHIISHHNRGLLLQIRRSTRPGLLEHSDPYQTRDEWHTTRTLTVSQFVFSYGVDIIQNTMPVMHATGGKRLYQWMGHALVYPLSPTVNVWLPNPVKLLCISCTWGQTNTLMHCRFRENMPNIGRVVSISAPSEPAAAHKSG